MNDEPPVNLKNRLHHVLVTFEQLSRIASVALVAAIGLQSWAIGALWYAVTLAIPPSQIAGGSYLLAVAADWAWLATLPKRGISFGPAKPPLLGLIVLRFILSLVVLLGCVTGISALACSVTGSVLQLLIWGVMVYATRVEPFRLGVTRIRIETSKLAQGSCTRLVQISDLHIERITRRERDLIAQVNALGADYILLIGDYLNFSYIGEPRAIDDAREVLGALRASHGTYAVRGTHQVDPNALLPLLFDGLPIRWLRNEHVIVGANGCRLTFAGASCSRERSIDVPAVRRALTDVPGDTFVVLMYHTPDLVPEAVSEGVDLYLAGHTHGGQLRLPWYGALITGTEAGKRYEMGQYHVGDLTLYVSRGIGMEGKGAPRARLFCPPEIVCIDVMGIGENEQ